MKFTKTTAIALAATPIGVASSYSIRPRYSSSPMQLFEPSSSVSRMLEKQRVIAQRMFDMVDQQQHADYPVGRGFPNQRYELVDNNEKFELTVDVPGVKEEDIDIKLEEGRLTIQGQRVASSESSRFSSKFSKAFSLDQTVDVDKFTATLKNGVLTVSAPKDLGKLEENVRRIPVTAALDTDLSEEKENTSSGDNDDTQKAEHKQEKETKTIDLDKDETPKNDSKDGKEWR